MHADVHSSRHCLQVKLTLGKVRVVIHLVARPLVGEGPSLACLVRLVLLQAAWPLLPHLQESYTLLVTR